MTAPPAAVQRAFGLRGTPEPLSGGRGTSWRIGPAVLKPADQSPAERAWHAAVLGPVVEGHVRVARPLSTADGQLIVDGWMATAFVSGQHQPGRWLDIVQAGEHLHRQLAAVPRPAFLAARRDPWAVADRVAWGDQPATPFLAARHVRRLLSCCRPVDAALQVIHADLTGNVLFAALERPAIIDFSPYWRPAPYASAIVVVDAVVWEGADPAVFRTLTAQPGFAQLLLRALRFRMVTDAMQRGVEVVPPERDPYQRLVDLTCDWASS
ncbi:aminoglycoside phosphotransferase [Deinococcus sp. KSM4-11]|uniref:aminoglycoside phosphotransferase n=1 Tax=Deinococcus sp. KSM4-11 TaxID=2568654 RepID=UPI0010A406D7|nr:aminoglycoside phosphotransferase [Deinococcus sp. KSM4-11]THF83609.1 aminoglycoside phosphotransferase [Deinococcus sp. KSM4-11]